MRSICDDLHQEHLALDQLVAGLTEAEWSCPTPAATWSIRDQISHLCFFDNRAWLALSDPDEFAADAERLMARGGTEVSVEWGRLVSGTDLLAAWRTARAGLLDLARTIDPSTRVPWYGPAMGARSFITARLMETWAHGYDVADALGATPAATARLKHVAHIGVRARPFSYFINDMEMPQGEVAVTLTAPDGTEWSWGGSATDTVRGGALDFCLVVTQRRHLADCNLSLRGSAAAEWLGIAQAFAGAPGGGRAPGQFAS